MNVVISLIIGLVIGCVFGFITLSVFKMKDDDDEE